MVSKDAKKKKSFLKCSQEIINYFSFFANFPPDHHGPSFQGNRALMRFPYCLMIQPFVQNLILLSLKPHWKSASLLCWGNTFA